jgi:glycerate kinase
VPVRILIAPDKFKGSLTARAAASAIAAGWQRARPSDDLCLLPITDGGDGFGDVVGGLLGAQERLVPTLDAARRPRPSRWAWAEATRTAVVESAESIGLALLPTGRFHPYELDTRGLGLVLRAVAESGGARCLGGVGGSATNDGGFGLARALGWHFTDRLGADLDRWTELQRLECILRPTQPVALGEVTVAVDVRNPLLGPQGCARIYGPQKGLLPEDFDLAERCLGRLAEVAQREKLGVAPETPGAGAAGGLGFGLAAFVGARLEPGFQLFAELAGLPARVRASELVLTGEGSLDASSLMGKGVGELAVLCRQVGVPCAALAGVVDRAAAGDWFSEALALTPDLTSPAAARADAAHWLAVAAERLAAQF